MDSHWRKEAVAKVCPCSWVSDAVVLITIKVGSPHAAPAPSGFICLLILVGDKLQQFDDTLALDRIAVRVAVSPIAWAEDHHLGLDSGSGLQTEHECFHHACRISPAENLTGSGRG